MEIIQTIQEWGNSAGIRLPKQILRAAHFSVDQKLTVSVKGDSVILKPVKEANAYILEKLLERVTPGMVGSEMEWGEEIGAEKYE